MKIGIGYDVHRFAENRDLYLGGIKFDYPLGLLGHSDADVLIHAIMDAVLGALALGDIGKLFPDTDPAYKDIDSKKLLARVVHVMENEGYCIGNVDSIVICEAPKLKDHIQTIRECLASLLHTDMGNVSVKATTTEQLGFEGRREGIAAQAVVLLERR
ncbi:2-C-methyl-D-erythritol 2,4-cyclodiphosphate synthase [Peptoniphilus equinus]|uniref:2-C-methyl-D-erythritol 2,4-cyclodiphosphate synthase n=1 Tax=Peptoniphilus equinus TaxID=3016343 RepID=A0ABY7QR17_9FIRM|nr:2-C-methyl-D-erythritol 2,4-cyclodiphosphate synthase [Peptoniphilus equinus]WBW49234.1 2-C-methyl-D-erythritol 2,4-cyclodiphosphate synthase [Peptoniphilus equinus]